MSLLQCRNDNALKKCMESHFHYRMKRVIALCVFFFSQLWDYILQFKKCSRFNLELQDKNSQFWEWEKVRILSLYLTVLRKNYCNTFFSQNFRKVLIELWDKVTITFFIMVESGFHINVIWVFVRFILLDAQLLSWNTFSKLFPISKCLAWM